MNIKTIALSAIVLFCLGITSTYAQQSNVSSGGVGSGSGGSVSYSVGQLVINTETGSAGSIAPGVQQPYEISEITGIEDGNGIQLQLSVFPNPSTDYLTISYQGNEENALSYQLYDYTGKLLITNKFSGTETFVDMSAVAPSTYFLRITENQLVVKSFQIIKN